MELSFVPPIIPAADELHWYAVYTAPRAEKKVAERFIQAGIEHYLPLQKVKRRWSDRVKEVEVPVVHGYIFVHIFPSAFRKVLSIYGAIAFVKEFHKPVPIPDDQIARLKFMVDYSEEPVTFSVEELVPGEIVTINRGPLMGLIGELHEIKGKHQVVIRIEKLGCALMIVPLSFINRG